MAFGICFIIYVQWPFNSQITDPVCGEFTITKIVHILLSENNSEKLPCWIYISLLIFIK